ncbi:histidine kinase [Streptomyces sp. NPDC050738]|uniref:sensor histidine kinase n=1 Tax=Streptomyces sp. NPDC050738 TaxID=3154744 RepID=UPI0034188A5C
MTARSPELRVAAGAIAGLREDLCQDPFAYRPLEPLRTRGALTRRLKWAPHILVLGAAAITLMLGLVTSNEGGPLGLLSALVSAGAVALTLLRPVGAWWIALAVSPLAAIFGAGWTSGGWVPASSFAYLVVFVVVGVRTRPRTAVGMWAVTVAYSVLAAWILDDGRSGLASVMIVVSGMLLLVVALVTSRRQAAQEITVQRQVTAVERERRTLLEERTTIARELHDVVAHHMSVVAIQAEAAPYRVENPPPELTRSFAVIRENAVAALTELRRVLGVVRAEDYEAPDAPQPTLAELDGLVANVRDAGLGVEKAVTGAVRELPPGVELSAYRIVQEALSNVLRHAPGAAARVEVSYVLGGLGLRVVNGPARGLVKPSPGAGHGITGMRERVSMLNGEMTAATTDDGGYEIAVFLPVAKAEAPEGQA